MDTPKNPADAARAARDALVAQKTQLELRKLRGELVDRAPAERHVRAMAAELRQSILNIPAERSTFIAEALGVEPADVQRVLRAELTMVLDRESGVVVDLAS